MPEGFIVDMLYLLFTVEFLFKEMPLLYLVPR